MSAAVRPISDCTASRPTRSRHRRRPGAEIAGRVQLRRLIAVRDMQRSIVRRGRNAGSAPAFAPRSHNGKRFMANDMINDIFSGQPNLSTTERAVSVALGLGIAAAAAQPRPNKILSLLALVVGVGLAVRGATGHCAVKAAADHL